jgi:hypothetical protein
LGSLVPVGSFTGWSMVFVAGDGQWRGVYADLFDEDLDDLATNLDAATRSAAAPVRPHPSEGLSPAKHQKARELG